MMTQSPVKSHRQSQFQDYPLIRGNGRLLITVHQLEGRARRY